MLVYQSVPAEFWLVFKSNLKHMELGAVAFFWSLKGNPWITSSNRGHSMTHPLLGGIGSPAASKSSWENFDDGDRNAWKKSCCINEIWDPFVVMTFHDTWHPLTTLKNTPKKSHQTSGPWTKNDGGFLEDWGCFVFFPKFFLEGGPKLARRCPLQNGPKTTF